MATRRVFLQTAALHTVSLAAASVLPWRVVRAGSLAALHPQIDPALGPEDPVLKALALRAVDAARAAGATYADVRFTSDRIQTVSPAGTFAQVKERGTVYVAVRALVADSWGVASAPDCTADAVVRIAQTAVALASGPRWATARPIQLDDAPPTATGHWSTPLSRDPFTVSIEEKSDFLQSCVAAPELLSLPDVTVQTELKFRRQEKVFASTTGAYLTQTLAWVGPSSISVTVANPVTWARRSVEAPAVPLQSGGYELVSALRPHDRLADLVEEVYRREWTTPVSPGRYTTVFDAQTTAALVRATIGYATELDRVRGSMVNTDGISYLTPAALGTTIADPRITITGTRALAHGPATVAWDDDGVAPQPFSLVTEGRLVDFATSRAEAPALRAWYEQRHHPVQSNGCAVADSAADMPLVAPPDLVLRPAAASATFEDLVSGAERGIAVFGGECYMDREQRAGQIFGTMYEIRRGKLGRCLKEGAVLLIRSTELWRNVVALGGTASAELRGFTSQKGEPVQQASHGVLAVPMTVQNVALIDAQQG